MMNFLKMLEDEISAWPNISVHPHRFGGKEFLFGNAEVGHIQTGGHVGIPFPRSVRDALLAEGLAEGHRWVPNSGWTTFRVRSDEDLKRRLDQKDPVTVVETLAPERYREAHLPGALNIPPEQIKELASQLLP